MSDAPNEHVVYTVEAYASYEHILSFGPVTSQAEADKLLEMVNKAKYANRRAWDSLTNVFIRKRRVFSTAEQVWEAIGGDLSRGDVTG